MHDPKAKERMIIELHEIGAIDFGQFTLKSGIISPYYLDLRMLVSFPHLLELVSDVLWERMRLYPFDLLVGIPYAALPIATSISLRHNRPLIFVRKERKDYGKSKLIEGLYHKGQHVVLIDDVISDGASKIETIKAVEAEGLVVSNIVVLLNRNQGGIEMVEKHGYRCFAITNMKEVLDVLYKHNRITKKEFKASQKFMKKTSLNAKKKKATKVIRKQAALH